MDFLKRAIAQIQTQLGVLTVSQKLVFVMCVVFIFAACWWMVDYSSSRQMVPLFENGFTDTQMRPIVNKMDGWGSHYKITGDRIEVLASEKRELMSRLSLADVLPEDTTFNWSTLVDGADMWTPESVRQDRKTIVNQAMLAREIMKMPGVQDATVFINKGSKRRLNNITPVASGSVHIKLKPGAMPDRKLAVAVASFIASANNRMRRENVTVIMDGRQFSIPPVGQELDNAYLEKKAELEQYYRQKILAALGIPGAMVEVDVDPQLTARRTHQTLVAPEGEGSWQAKVDESGDEQSSTNTVTTSEPGMMANVPERTGSSGGRTQQETGERTGTTYRPFPGTTDIIEETGAAGVESKTAVVRIPQSYFKAQARALAGLAEDAEVDGEQVKTLTAQALPDFKDAVMRAMGLTKTAENEDCVVVSDYWDGWGDVIAARQADAAVTMAGQADTAGMGMWIKRYGKHAGVTVLALMSLGLMIMMVRKNAEAPAVRAADGMGLMAGSDPMEVLGVDEANIEDGGTGGGVLAGMEMDDAVVQSRKILEQVRGMVEDSPEMAAGLLGRWIDEGLR